jgi:hypothetical protein
LACRHPFSEASTSLNRSDSTGAMALERLVEQQAFGADAERAAERDQFLLAAAEQQRLAVAHRGELADRLVDEI